MNILVTGGAGFIGTNLIKKLINDKHTIVSIDNYSSGYKENEQNNCYYYNVNLKDDLNFNEYISNPDVIFHLGALSRIQPSIKDPSLTIRNNFIGTLNILEFAKKSNCQVIYSGSSSYHHGLYGSPYAWSKYGGEELCKLYSKVYSLDTTICRFYNVYGPHHVRSGEFATVIGIFEHQTLNNLPLTIVGNGTQRRDFTHVNDIVNGLINCINKKNYGEIYEFGTGENYSINEVADIFEGEKKYIDYRPGEYQETLCDIDKAKKELGWEAKRSLKKYIVDWKRDNK